ncbi:kinase-like protein, partial [Fistulina hepatica ATCC 64428]
EDEEDEEDYVSGGYHPVHIGDRFSSERYVVVRKLGWGHFSTVWLARDEQRARHVALKVVKSAPRYTETAIDEIKLLQALITPNVRHKGTADAEDPTLHPGRSHVIAFLDHFRHTGPNGVHVCMVFEVLGENLLGLLRRHQKAGVPMHLVRQIARQILLGLDYMHRVCGVIHTDIKPENVLVAIDDVEGIVRAELALQDAQEHDHPHAPRMIGVPPSTGRGGNQTPRSESVFITGSRPLSSPSSSSSLSSMWDVGSIPGTSLSSTDSTLDRWGFGMTKLDESKADGALVHALSPDVDAHLLGLLATTPGVSTSDTSSATATTFAAPTTPTQSGHLPTPGSAVSSGSILSPPSATSQGVPGVLSPAEEHISVKIADLGNATWTTHHFTDDIQTRQYRAPEVILGAKWGTSADVWSVACLLFELITGGDYLFDPASGTKYSKDDDHIAQIMELMGEIPASVRFGGKYTSEFFNRRGELRRISKLRYWPLDSVLREKYRFPPAEAVALSAFLVPMLNLHPERRASAGEMARHKWLEGVVVQGDTDVARRIQEL